VARADAAEDFSGPGCFEQLSGMCLAVADRHSIKVEHAGDWHRGQAGRSIYLGGREAVTRLICYEKGLQVGGDPTHTRVELRVRPKGAGKLLASACTPLQLWGGARWSLELGCKLTGEEVQRMSLGTVYRDEDHKRAVRMLLRQYGPTLRTLCDEHGSWSAVGEYLGEGLSQVKRQ
jgi:DNA relaxase NicK